MFGYTGLVRDTAGYFLVIHAWQGVLLGMFGYTGLVMGTAGECLILQVW